MNRSLCKIDSIPKLFYIKERAKAINYLVFDHIYDIIELIVRAKVNG